MAVSMRIGNDVDATPASITTDGLPATDLIKVTSVLGQTVYQDATSPVSLPAQFRTSIRRAANHAGRFDVSGTAMPVVKAGRDIMFEATAFGVADMGTEKERVLPYRVSIVFNVPSDDAVTSGELSTMLNRAIAYIAKDEEANVSGGLTLALRGITERG